MNLASRLNKSGLPQEEIEEYIQSLFGMSEHNDQSVVYRKNEGQWIELVYSKKGNIKEVRYGNLEDAEIENIFLEIELIRNFSHKKVARKIMFSMLPVEGRCRIENIQILSLPRGAPRPEYGLYGLHPFIVEFEYKKSGDVATDLSRKLRKSHEVGCLLRVLIPMICGSQELAAQGWFLGAGQQESVFGTSAYSSSYVDLADRDEFDATEKNGILIEEHRLYYETHGSNGDFKFIIPNTIGISVENYSSLQDESASRYLRAIEWFSIAQDLFSNYSSASFVALVSAVECLMESEAPNLCNACGRQKGTVTERFIDFVENTIPEWFPRDQLKELYNVRSSLVHGAEMKLGRLPFLMGNRSVRYQQMHRRLSAGVRAICIAWLHSDRAS